MLVECVTLTPEGEEPTVLEEAALLIFTSVADAWTVRGGGFTEERLGWFRMDMAKIEAEGLGFEWTPQLQVEVRRCVRWFRQDYEARRKK